MVNLWLDKTQEKLSEIPHIDSNEIRQKIETEMPKVNENMSKFYQNFRIAFNL